MSDDYLEKIEVKIKEQSTSKKVGFLLGAGSTYLDGNGYPLASQLWGKISADVPEKDRQDIQSRLDSGANGLEHALDLLDTGQPDEGSHRSNVVTAIAKHFACLDPPLEYHRLFLSLLSQREEETPIRVFSLNYDPLIERASELEKIRLFDGFHGNEEAFFDAESFKHTLVLRERSFRGRRTRAVRGNIRLVKLHGSTGWYQDEEIGIRRRSSIISIPESAKRLMIPPQYRKARDTGRPPYSNLWSEFRGSLIHGDDPLMRLVTLGYGMADEHVNAEIESALARSNFTLIIVAKKLCDEAFNKWSAKKRVHIVTESKCSLNGEIGKGHLTMSSFEGFVKGMNQWQQ